jgi:uncharacterized protein YecT (DUF1311 family)
MREFIHKKATALLITAALLSGCTAMDVNCTSEEAKTALLEAMRKDISESITQNLKDLSEQNSSGISFGSAMAKQLVDKFDLKVSGITELWKNPDRKQKSCRGTLEITVDTKQVKRATDARSALDMLSIADLATQSGVEFDGRSRFTQEIDFSLSLADDTGKVNADLGSSFTIFNTVAETSAYNVLSASIVKNKRDEDVLEMRAESEQKRAAIALAKEENRMAIKALGEVWSQLLPETRSQLVGLQKAWIRKRNADCRIESINASEDGSDIKVNQLNCDTRAQLERREWLLKYVPAEAAF